MLYVLDEPSVGLHPSNVAGLLKAITALTGNGNSVVVVEHERDVIRSADWVIELGPAAGAKGGTVIAQGPPGRLETDPRSVIGPFLAGTAAVTRDRPARPSSGGQGPGGQITIEIGDLYNLHDLTAAFPVGRLTALAGPSGAGKTALVLDSLIPAARALLSGSALPAHVRRLDLGGIRQVVQVDAAPIGQNARSTPATYSGALDHIRREFAESAYARRRRWKPGHFSFNTREGQCPTCFGLGHIDLDVQYLPDIAVQCPACHGARFNDATLAVRVDGLTIADVLGLSADDALERFAGRAQVAAALRPVSEVGLGYLRLGEPTPSLSGGESQRLRIASRLRASQRGALYVFDEPSTGLHPLDVSTLVGVFDRLLGAGATIIVIDHDLDLLAVADHLIDMGPGGGPDGGRIVAAGTPEDVARAPASVTRALPGRVEGGREQVAGRQAAIGPPLLGDGQDLLLRGEVIEPIGGLDGLAKREIAWQDDVFTLQRDEEGALHGPRANARMAVSSVISSSSGRWLRTSVFSLPSDIRAARSRSVLTFRHESPAARSWSGSTLSSSAGSGRCPPNMAWMRARVRRVAATDSCWPVTWNSRAPNRSIGGSWDIQALGSKSGRSSMSRASTGSASRRYERAPDSHAARQNRRSPIHNDRPSGEGLSPDPDESP